MLTMPSPVQSLWDHLRNIEAPPAPTPPVAPKRDEPFTNADLHALLMDGERFMAWLIRQGPGSYVGISHSTQACPVATYLLATVPGAVHVRVCRYAQVYTPAGLARTALPTAAGRFVHLVDRSGAGSFVTAHQAMRYCREAGWYPPRKEQTR